MKKVMPRGKRKIESTTAPFSTTSYSSPARAAAIATPSPAGPAPTTTRSSVEGAPIGG